MNHAEAVLGRDRLKEVIDGGDAARPKIALHPLPNYSTGTLTQPVTWGRRTLLGEDAPDRVRGNRQSGEVGSVVRLRSRRVEPLGLGHEVVGEAWHLGVATPLAFIPRLERNDSLWAGIKEQQLPLSRRITFKLGSLRLLRYFARAYSRRFQVTLRRGREQQPPSAEKKERAWAGFHGGGTATPNGGTLPCPERLTLGLRWPIGGSLAQ